MRRGEGRWPVRRTVAMFGIGLAIAFVAGVSKFQVQAASGGFTLQTLDSCRQTLGGSQFEIKGGSVDEVVTTPASPLHSVGSGNCPLQRGDCSSTSDGCVQVAPLPFPASYTLHETATPPANSGNPQGYAPCNAGSACQSQTASVSIDATGNVTATTTNVDPDGTVVVSPNGGTFNGSSSDPIVFHDFGLGSGSCDGDHDADDHLTGTPSTHCAYPEAAEASACQPYPWSCSVGGPPPPPPTTHYALSNPGSQTAGGAFNETITVLDSNNHQVTSYSGSQSLSWSGPSRSPNGTAAQFPANPVAFSKGSATVSLTLFDAQSTSLTVSDGTVSASSAPFSVGPAAARTFSLANPGSRQAGQSFAERVTAYDPYGNVATTYSGRPSLSGPHNSPNGTAPAYSSNPLSFAKGSATATITLFDAERTALNVSDGSVSGTSGTFAVGAGTLHALNVGLPSQAVSASSVTATVSTVDSWGNLVTGYTATVKLASSDSVSNSLKSYPHSVKLSAGQTSFSITFYTPGQQTLTASGSGLRGTGATTVA